MAAEIKIPTTFTAKDKFSQVVSKMGKGVKNWSKVGVSAVKRFDSKITSSFKRLGKLTTLIVGLSLGALFTNTFQDITKFETGLTGVSKTTGLADSKLKNLGKEILDTSKNLRGISTEKLLELAQSAGQLGVSSADDILKFSVTLAKLEKASDIQGEAGASAIARLLTITREGTGIVDQFASSLVALGNKSAATEAEILEVGSEVARSTAAYKLNSKQILGIAATLKSLDVRPQAAGTAVGKVFRGIELATIKGGKILQNYGKIMGLTSKQVRDTFKKDPEAAFNSFIKGLNRISNEGGSVAKSLLNVGLNTETVSKGIVPLATNYDLLNKKMKLASDGFKENSALGQEFNTATKTVQTALDSIKISWSNVFIEQANAGTGMVTLRGVLFSVADNMGKIVIVGVSLVGLFITMKAIILATSIITGLYSIALGINTAVTQTNKRALIGNTIATNAYKVAMAIGTGVTWLATVATTAFGVALNLGLWPILAIIAAIVAVVLIIKNWSAITDWFGEKWGQFTKFIGEAWNKVVGWFTDFDFKQMFIDIGQSILKFMLTPLKFMLTLLSKLPGKLGSFAKIGLETIDKVTGEVSVKNEVLPSTNQSSSQAVQESLQNRSSLDVTIRDKGNNVEKVKENSNNNIPINITNTVGAF